MAFPVRASFLSADTRAICANSSSSASGSSHSRPPRDYGIDSLPVVIGSKPASSVLEGLGFPRFSKTAVGPDSPGSSTPGPP